jgi:dolichol-phosphate mannosyltransferase
VKLSIIIPTLNEADNVRLLIPRLHRVTGKLMNREDYEILLVDAGSQDDIAIVAEETGATLIQVSRGYGYALRKGFLKARGKYIITMDADLSHNPYVIPQLYSYRDTAEFIIASRNIQSGYSSTEWTRSFLSKTLNTVFGFVFDLKIKDMSSGFRLYHKRIFNEFQPEKRNFVVLLEILLKAHLAGFRIKEIPFHYHPRKHGGSKARILQFGIEYLGFLWEGWKLRNSINCADYEEREFSSRFPFQRAWHRKRHEIIVSMARDYEKILDVGCGSSQILDGLPQADGCDIRLNKLRYKRAPFRRLVCGDVRNLPFKTGYYDAVIFSEVLEILPDDPKVFDEIIRVVRPGGHVIVATMNYNSFAKAFISLYRIFQPEGYGAKHKSRHTYSSILKIMKSKGLRLLKRRNIFGLEMVLKFRKPE